MYFFYLDESGSRDPLVGTPERQKDHVYVLLAVGMYERQWRPFDLEVSQVKLGLIGGRELDLADCEVKSNWLRRPKGRRNSKFLNPLPEEDIQRLTDVYFDQVAKRNAVVIASVIDKRRLPAGTTSEWMQQKAYELLLERIQHYMSNNHRRHQALIIMDDTGITMNRAVAMRHAHYLRSGNWNATLQNVVELPLTTSGNSTSGIQLEMGMAFSNIVEYPFFTRSELSNGVQLADQLAYDVYHAFRYKKMEYPYFTKLLPHFYRSRDGSTLHGLKVWPEDSRFTRMMRVAWSRR